MVKQLTTKIVYANPWMTVREDEVEFSPGKRGVYGVVEKPDFAMIVPFDGTHFYLVRQFRYPIQKWSLEFPQGTHETNPNLDPVLLAKAELQEETGLTAGRLEEVGFVYEAPGYCNQGFHIFMASDLTVGEQRLESTEQGLTVRKVSVPEFEQLINTGELSDGPSITAFGLMKSKKLI